MALNAGLLENCNRKIGKKNLAKCQGKDYNSVKIPCFMCLNPDIDLKGYNQLMYEINDLKTQIQVLKNSDSCCKLLEKLPMIPKVLKPLEKPLGLLEFHKEWQINMNEDYIKMITLTFDPRKFPRLTNRQAQRNYLYYIIEQMHPLGEIYGCFELHETGVVHTHFLVKDSCEKELDFLKSKLTIKLANYNDTPVYGAHAVHICQKLAREGFDYINKKETKDLNAIYNFYKNI